MSAHLQLRALRAAWVFMSRVPAGGLPFTPGEWRWCSAHFPLVGLGIGAGMAAVHTLASLAGALPAAVLALCAGAALTGALHEDGLADTADALGGAASRPQLFDILKDSRVGAFGSLAVTASFVLRAGLLAELAASAAAALILSQCLSRAPLVWMMAGLPYVTDPARARSRAVAQASLPQAAVATAWAAALALALTGAGSLSPAAAVAAVLALLAVSAACALVFRSRAGGFTGDFLGAAQQAGECAVLFALAATGTGAT